MDCLACACIGLIVGAGFVFIVCAIYVDRFHL